MCWSLQVPWRMWRLRMTEESVLFPPVMWIPGIKPRSPDLYVSVFPAEPTLPSVALHCILRERESTTDLELISSSRLAGQRALETPQSPSQPWHFRSTTLALSGCWGLNLSPQACMASPLLNYLPSLQKSFLPH